MNKASIYILLCSFIAALGLHAADTMDADYNERIKSVRIARGGDDYFSPPIVTLGTGDFLTISFDHLSDDREFLRWRLVRCDANWQPSRITEGEWLDGFNESRVERYEFSGPTTVHYVHYEFDFPSEDLSPTLSGNYLIEVFPEDDPENVWFARRVMVSEQSAPISVNVSTVTDVDYNNHHQQLAIAVDTERAHVSDPFNDLTVYVAQNGRRDNERVMRQPLRRQGNMSIYEHTPQLIFTAGNEYRRVEVADVNYPGMGVESISYAYPYYHFTLYPDESRADGPYVYDSTQHGRFTPRVYGSDDPDTDADYVVVHFALNVDEMPGSMIFLDGDFTARRFDPASIMNYNRATGRYEKVMLLKQGAYNYQYLTVPQGTLQGLTAPVEGDFHDTSNEYLIKVYTRGPVDRTDRLIGVTLINSQP